MKLKGSVSIVTGGGRGIGRAIAITLAKEGSDIVIVSRTKSELEETASEVKRLGREVLSVSGDVRKKKDVENVVNKAFEKFGKIDILVNNAGVAYYKPLVKTSEEEWDETFDTNVKGIYLVTREVLPIMEKQKSGIIINISSGAGKHGFANLSAYCASKFAVIGFTQSLADELFDKGIKVYAVCPGGVDTKMYRDVFGSSRFLLKPEHVAEKVKQLCINSNVKSGSAVNVYSIADVHRWFTL